MNSKTAKLRKFIRTLALNGALLTLSVVIALFLAEIAVRVVSPQQLILIRPDLWMPIDTVGWVHRPDVNTTINTGERTVSVRTDHSGYRVGTAGRAEGTPVLVIGDSFMEALQVEYEGSFPAMLESELSRTAGEAVAVRNAGIGGWDPNQYLLRTRSLVGTEPFELVIVSVYLGNDIIESRRDYFPPRAPVERHSFRFPRSASRRELIDAVLRPLNDALEVRSHLFILIRSRLESLRMRAGLHPLAFPVSFYKHTADSERWALTADVLADLDSVAASTGAHAVFILIPAPFQVDEASFASYARGFGLDSTQVDLLQPNRRLTEEMTARGLDVIDVLPAFKAAHDRGVALYGSVDPHLSPDGHEILTQVVAPAIAPLMRNEGMPKGPIVDAGA